MARLSRSGLGALGRLALAALFAIASRMRYSIEIHGLERTTRAPRTYFAITHKRDMDSVAPLPPLLAHLGWRALLRDVHFAMRGDSFERGFLSRIVLRPRWFLWLLRPISVGPVLRAVGVHPINGLQFHPAESWLREALRAEGDAPAGDRLSQAFQAYLAQAIGMRTDTLAALPLSHLLRWRFHAYIQGYIGPEIFAGAARRRAERRLLATAKRQLDDLADWLRRGGSLYTAPEGALSPDGRVSSIPAGLHRVLRAAPADTSVQPIVIVYDFMTVRRPRLFIDVAPAIEGADGFTSHDLAITLRASWLANARFTCTQLASEFLRLRLHAAIPAFAETDLAAHVYERAVALVAAGRHVDGRLLHRASVHRLAHAYLAYCERRGLVARTTNPAAVDPWQPIAEPPAEIARGDPGYGAIPLTYACNELDEMLDVAEHAAPASSYLPF